MTEFSSQVATVRRPYPCFILFHIYWNMFLASRSKSVDFECSLTPVLLPPWAALKELLIVNRLYSTLLSSTDRMSTSGGQLSERENWNRKKEKKERRGREDCWIAPQAGFFWGQQRERRSRGSFLGSNEAVNPTKQENSFLRTINTKQLTGIVSLYVVRSYIAQYNHTYILSFVYIKYIEYIYGWLYHYYQQ